MTVPRQGQVTEILDRLECSMWAQEAAEEPPPQHSHHFNIAQRRCVKIEIAGSEHGLERDTSFGPK